MSDEEFNRAYLESDMLYGREPSYELVNFIKSTPEIHGIALDLGCGDGRDSIFLARNNFSVTSVDISKVALTKLRDAAEKEHLQIRCLNLDVKDFEFRPESYDLIVSTTLLDHLEQETRDNVIHGMKQSLKIDGFLYVEVFTIEDPGCNRSKELGEIQDLKLRNLSSEFASKIKHYFEKGELSKQFHNLKTILYIEKLEPDTHHGAFHYHGVARLVAKKVR